MTHKYDILFSGEYITPFSSPRMKSVNLNFGFTINNEFQDESEFQEEPYLTIAKDKIIRRLKKKGYTDITITSIKAVPFREKRRRGSTINKLAKRFLGL